MGAPLFEVGLVVATPRALALAEAGAFDPAELLERHVCGDWGDLDAFDRRENERALRSGARIFMPTRRRKEEDGSGSSPRPPTTPERGARRVSCSWRITSAEVDGRCFCFRWAAHLT
jgi:hypothetical protein